MDAALPPAAGATPVAPPELLALLRDKASGGLLPRWTDWWDEEEVAPLFPDQAIRQAVTAEQPRLPLSYYEASVPVPAGWDAQPCAYLLFGLPYDELASEARGRGWVVEQLPGRHLHQLVDPDGVARVAAGDHRADGDHHAYPSRVVHLVGPVWYTGSSGLRGRNQADTERMASPVQRHGPTLDSHDHRRA